MKLRNKKTGDIKELKDIMSDMIDNHIVPTLIAIENEWEDVTEEPKGYWSYDTFDNDVTFNSISNKDDRKADQQIGNYFETKEEAELAVRKLKAWKRLKDKGIRFEGWTIDDGLRISICTNCDSDGIYDEGRKETKEDLDICFGGEE